MKRLDEYYERSNIKRKNNNGFTDRMNHIITAVYDQKNTKHYTDNLIQTLNGIGISNRNHGNKCKD
ncbi:hypothetical protein BLOT_013819 [Blomia tropicalis]|nr:hypothetical protein BLOT_013819 [Blomia tropicalis]